MIVAASCPACGSDHWVSWPALISGFIQNHALRESHQRCNLRQCVTCGFRYFDLRYEDAELGRLYDDYRGSNYQQTRQQYERGYTDELNQRLGADAPQRNADLAAFLDRHGLKAISAAVIDYGGDTGEFIPSNFIGPRYVYDISGKPTVEGVERIDDRATLAALDPEFVLLAHVLEHVPHPLDLLKVVGGFMSAGATLYVEVPLERPRIAWLRRGRFYEAWLKVVARHGFLRRCVEAYDGLGRLWFNAALPLGVTPLHEHINFFDDGSLRALLSRARFQVVALETERTLIRALAKQSRECLDAREGCGVGAGASPPPRA